MLQSPLSCQGFYATRIAMRRIGRSLMVAAITAFCVGLGAVVSAMAVLDFLGAVTWGLR
jgi:ABC-type dipeptide/oligopeptide/nickel transport system permease subunit